MERHDEVQFILLLDNCSEHNVSKDKSSRYIIILSLPSSVTRWHQPADTGIIASLKVRYQVKIQDILLSLIEASGGYKSASIARALQPSGMKGLDDVGKATILDANEDSTVTLWEVDHKYAYSHSIARHPSCIVEY